MEFLKKLGKAVGGAMNYVEEKNRKAAALNRIRAVIRCEEKAAERQYLALGRYYYNNLRDRNNSVTEAHCAELEAIEARLDAAILQLENFYSAEEKKKSELREEIDLEDVQCLEMPPESDAAPLPVRNEEAPAAPDENDSLPFEG